MTKTTASLSPTTINELILLECTCKKCKRVDAKNTEMILCVS